jgi:4-hydroxybutyryl-CoA dehydratase / vinylacetyl-CoA-Delta-isomerase
LVTGPSGSDWSSPEIRPYLEKLLVGAAPTSDRLAIFNLASDLLARSYGGYQGVLAMHAEGSLEAETIVLYCSYDPEPAIALVQRLAGFSDRTHTPDHCPG